MEDHRGSLLIPSQSRTGGSCYLLAGDFEWEERLPFDDRRSESPSVDAWIYVRSWLAERQHVPDMVRLIVRHEGWPSDGMVPHRLGGWLGEYPLGAYTGFPDESLELKLPPLKDSGIALVRTACKYYNEYEYPSIRHYIPSPSVLDMLGLRWSGRLFEFTDADGKTICFDPSAETGGLPSCLIDAQALDGILARHSLGIVWTVIGEYRALHSMRSLTRKEFAAVYWTLDGRISGRRHFVRVEAFCDGKRVRFAGCRKTRTGPGARS